jgi:transcriptional regulator with PAS, ATPase and Fis domain
MTSTPSTVTQLDYARIRQRAMQTLFDSLDSLCEGTVVVDKDAHIVWINERYASRFGPVSAADAIGKNIEEIIPRSLMREVVNSGQPILLDILEAGSESFVVTRLPLKDDQGQVIGAVGFALYDQLQPLQPLYAKLDKLQRDLAQAQKKLAEERRSKYTFTNFIGSSAAAMEVKRQARRAARLEATVLLLGETGTGKELLAHAIHASSSRANKPFIGINVAAIPETLLEAEFFGTAAGAYTGAERKGRIGKFQLADGGTLFLDEIGDMPLAVQAKLLRVLQEQEVEPLGSNHIVNIDVRVIAATSIDLQQAMEEGRFRRDLYYRINVLPIHLPPLRERPEDIEALCENMLEQMAIRAGEPLREVDAEAVALLQHCPWPGNVRELRNVLERAGMLSDQLRLGAADFAAIVQAATPESAKARPLAPTTALQPNSHAACSHAEALAQFERQLIVDALEAADGRVSEAARRLGLARATLYKKMTALGIPPGS